MSPFKSSKGRSLGKLIEGFKSSTIGQGFGSGSGAAAEIRATGGIAVVYDNKVVHLFQNSQTFTTLDTWRDYDVEWIIVGAIPHKFN